jgi:hypothetical protein
MMLTMSYTLTGSTWSPTKNGRVILMRLITLFIVAGCLLFSCNNSGNIEKGNHIVYYLDSENGDDAHSGTSAGKAFKTLGRVSSVNLRPGDRVLLAAGQVFPGSLQLSGVNGTQNKPVLISSFNPGNAVEQPVINAAGYPGAVLIENCSFVEVENLILTAPGRGELGEHDSTVMKRCGVLTQITRQGNYQHIVLRNLVVKDVFYENPGFIRPEGEVKTANGTQRYGWGIRVINNIPDAKLNDVQILSCLVENVSHTGIKLTSRSEGKRSYGIQDIKIYDNRVLVTGGPGIQMGGVFRGHIRQNYINGSGSYDDSRKWGRGSGLWTWGSANIVIEENQFLNANGPGDSAGAHIDFNCESIVLQYNFSANNAGGFCEILGNNHNCAYRYNVSVNDGYRIKGENNAFQEGKTFWLSGFQGKRPRSGPFNSYFYNNTIFVKEDIVSKIAVDRAASGIMVANNIFFIEGESKLVMGDQYKPDKAGASEIKNVIFKNNLYFDRYSWPKDVMIQDQAPIIGNPLFRNKGGLSISDYIPANTEIIKDQGIEIMMLPMDSIGLVIGLSVSHDILGNQITGLPDLGAIEVN